MKPQVLGRRYENSNSYKGKTLSWAFLGAERVADVPAAPTISAGDGDSLAEYVPDRATVTGSLATYQRSARATLIVTSAASGLPAGHQKNLLGKTNQSLSSPVQHPTDMLNT